MVSLTVLSRILPVAHDPVKKVALALVLPIGLLMEFSQVWLSNSGYGTGL